MKIKVGVFDSGIGGKSVANAITENVKNVEVLYVNDKEHLPYGDKTPQQLLELVLPILEKLVEQGCQVIVIACNTVTTTIIKDLRQQISVPLIGIEPMVKPASEITKSKVITVCATPATLASKRYRELKDKYGQGLTIIEPDCSKWASMIESNNLDHELIKQQIEEAISLGSDVIVLGCTHYHWIREDILNFTQGKAEVIQPEKAIVKRLKRILEEL